MTDQTQEAAQPPEKRTYEVELSGTVYTSVTVEAEDEDEAHDLAKDAVSWGHTWDDDVFFLVVEGMNEIKDAE